MEFIKNCNIYPMFRNYILIGTKIESLHGIELFIARVGLSVICIYSADDVRESSSRPVELTTSFFTILNYEH